MHEGVRAFYKGMLPTLLRITPATAITFVVYENVSHYYLLERSAAARCLQETVNSLSNNSAGTLLLQCSSYTIRQSSN